MCVIIQEILASVSSSSVNSAALPHLFISLEENQVFFPLSHELGCSFPDG
jgi:hypothetical protein